MSLQALKNRMQSVIEQELLNSDGIRLLLIDTRIAIEELEINREYPTIGMYGNWCVHPKLTNNVMYHNIISDVQSAYESCKNEEKEELKKLGLTLQDPEAKHAPISGKAMNNFFINMHSCFRILELRKEILDFFKKYNIETFVVDIDNNWSQFVFLLMRSLVNRPLEVPENKRMYSQLKSRSEREHMTPVKLFLEERKIGKK